jgi:hypothetical protein
MIFRVVIVRLAAATGGRSNGGAAGIGRAPGDGVRQVRGIVNQAVGARARERGVKRPPMRREYRGGRRSTAMLRSAMRRSSERVVLAVAMTAALAPGALLPGWRRSWRGTAALVAAALLLFGGYCTCHRN